MNYCHGSPSEHRQADCGDIGPHDGHDFADVDRVCVGAPTGFEADCGSPGPHLAHPFGDKSGLLR